MKKLKIDVTIEGDDIVFTIQRSKGLSLIEILGLLEHISTQVGGTIKQRLKITQTEEKEEKE